MNQHEDYLNFLKLLEAFEQDPRFLSIESLAQFELTNTVIDIFPLYRALGTGEPAFSMNYGKLHASIDRVEAIVTQSDRY